MFAALRTAAASADRSYEAELRMLAESIGSDGCTKALQIHQVCCWEHDWSYVTRTTPKGSPTTKGAADAQFRRCIQQRSPLRRLSLMAWWRWLAVHYFGRGQFVPRTVPRFVVVDRAGLRGGILAEAQARREDLLRTS